MSGLFGAGHVPLLVHVCKTLRYGSCDHVFAVQSELRLCISCSIAMLPNQHGMCASSVTG